MSSVNINGDLARVLNDMNTILGARSSDEATIFRQGSYTTIDGVQTKERMAVELSRHIDFERPSGGQNPPVPVQPPDILVQRWASCPDDRVPELLGCWAGPLLAPDGSCRTERGYDRESLMWLQGWDGPDPGETMDDANEAANRLISFVDVGQFTETIDTVAWLAHVLTVAARPTIAGAVPGFIYSSSATGSGKTTLARVAGKIGGGSDQYVTYTPNDAELCRKLDKHTLRPAVVIDNLRATLQSESLESAVTNGTLGVRRLYIGHVDVPFRCVLGVTANGVELGRDWIRRVIPIRIDPVKLDGNRNLLTEVTPQLVADAATIIRAWLLSGEESACTPLPSFAEWSRVVGGALCWLGLGDVSAGTRDNVEGFASADADDAAILDAIVGWAGDCEFKSKDLAEARGENTHLREALAKYPTPADVGRRLSTLHDSTRAIARRTLKGTTIWRVFSR